MQKSGFVLSRLIFEQLFRNMHVNQEKVTNLVHYMKFSLYKNLFIRTLVMHQSFVSTDPSGPGISGAFNFSIFKTLLSGAKIVDKSLLKAPALPEAYNNEEQQMT